MKEYLKGLLTSKRVAIVVGGFVVSAAAHYGLKVDADQTVAIVTALAVVLTKVMDVKVEKNKA